MLLHADLMQKLDDTNSRSEAALKEVQDKFANQLKELNDQHKKVSMPE